MLKLPLIFADHMILQREKPVAVWGSAAPGAAVTVAVQGRTAAVAADEAGAWKLTLEPLNASFSETMIVTDGAETLTLNDVQVGEVWLAGGQSNMEFHMRYDADMAAEKECPNDAIRFFDYPEVSYVGQIDEADFGKQYGFWRKAVGETDLERFSAPGYYFAKDIAAKYQVPVGIIGCNWGGTPACAWMDRDSIAAGGGQAWLDEYEEATKGLDLEEYNRRFAANSRNFRIDQLDDPFGDKIMFGASFEDVIKELQGQGINFADMSKEMMPQIGPKYPNRPAGLYESMLLPLVPYSLRGFLWYQGETDGDRHGSLYATLFPAMIRCWRRLWGEELPFLFVQIAPLERWAMANGTPYAVVREAQQHTADTLPGTGMAVTSDVGMRWDIHPKKKQPVGHRLALLAEKLVYGENVLCEAPTLIAAEPAEGSLTLRFTNAGEGLHFEFVTPYGEALPADRFSGIAIEQNGGAIDPDTLIAKAEGDTVILTGDVLHALPTTAEIGRGGWYQVNLYNSADLPARPAKV